MHPKAFVALAFGYQLAGDLPRAKEYVASSMWLFRRQLEFHSLLISITPHPIFLFFLQRIELI